MAKNDPASLVAGAGLLTGIFTKLNAEVTALGGTEQDLHRLTTPAGNETIRQMAKLVTAEGAILHRPLEFLGFNLGYVPDLRAYNCLGRAGIETVSDLVNKTAYELRAIPNFGEKSLKITIEKLAHHGLALSGEDLPAATSPKTERELDAKTATDKLFELCKLLDVKIDLTHKIADHHEMERRWQVEEDSGSYGGELAGPEGRARHRRDAEKLEGELSDISANINALVAQLSD